MNGPNSTTRHTTIRPNFDVENLRSAKNLQFAATLSALAYQNEAAIRLEIGNFGGESHFLYGKNTFAFVAKFSEFAFVVFRGTHTRQDWKDNLDVRTINTFCGRVHCGFARCLDSIPTDQIQNIWATIKKPTRMFLAGHSKGGALAVLAAALLARNGSRPDALYTFGQPKVGTKSFVRWFDENGPSVYLRAVNGADIVPHLPPSLEDIPYFLSAGIGLALILLHSLVAFPIKAVRRVCQKHPGHT
jgi:triacylglycerol lipase